MAGVTFLFANNTLSTLVSSLSPSDTTIVLAPGTGVEFPNPGANERFALTLIDAVTQQFTEICYCTARATDTLTVLRAQEGTSARSWAAGDLASNYVTAGTLAAFAQSQVLPIQPVYGEDVGSANTIIINPTPALLSYRNGQSIIVLPAASNTGATTINSSSLGNKAVRDQDGNVLIAGMIKAGILTLMLYDDSDGFFRLVPSLLSDQAISSLASRGTLLTTDMVAVSNGTKNYRTTVSDIGQTIGAQQFLTSYYLGMMGG